ncbi:MAG: YegS/Rv2252/BmrU family lipid kinase [Peptococcaceae bacterium]|jgi:YegS/Rv2252/BmrU family lipid kinase|nr:YegS/Rv2252/BmrU family lipid kinase [Peptococcaceae bacterium]
MRNGLLIYNPNSGTQAVSRILDAILAYALDQGLYLLPFRLQPSPENRALLSEMIQAPWVEFVIVSGGDGTLGSVAQLILSLRPETPMGIIPSGTCNDFAESLHLPQDEWDCINIVAENDSVPLDVGRINGEHIFLSTCAAGMFVNVSFSVSNQLKKALGSLAYYFSALGELPNIRSFPLRIETESEVVEDDFLLFLLLNGSRAAGFANLYNKARMRDGYMDLLLIRDVPPVDLPNLLIEILNRESVDSGRFFRSLRAKRFRLTSPQIIQTSQDGEEGLPLPLDVEVVKQALNVFVRRNR